MHGKGREGSGERLQSLEWGLGERKSGEEAEFGGEEIPWKMMMLKVTEAR